MSIRIVPAILAAAVSVAFVFPPANAQQSQPPQSLRLYVLDCGIITPLNVDNYGLKPNEVADTRMVTPCFLIAHPRGTIIWDTGEIPDSAFKDGVSPQKLNGQVVPRAMLLQHVWDLHFDPTTNIIDVYVGRVRRKVDGQQAYPIIHTVRGVGF